MFRKCRNLNTQLNILGNNITKYDGMFSDSVINSGAKIILNYTTSSSNLVDNIIVTKDTNSKVVKGEKSKSNNVLKYLS